MKNLIFAVAFTLLSLFLPLGLAQLALAQNAAPKHAPEVQAPVSPESVTANNSEPEGIVVNLSDNEEVEQAEEEITEVIEKLSEVFGESFGTELKLELNALSDHEKKQLSDKVSGLFNREPIHISDDHLGVGKVLIALVAISLTLGLPVIILLVLLISGHRKRRQLADLVGTYIAANQAIPEHVMAEFGNGMSGNKRLRSGLQLLFVGAALAIFLGVVAEPKLATIGLIPMAMGAARLIYWKYDSTYEIQEGSVD